MLQNRTLFHAMDRNCSQSKEEWRIYLNDSEFNIWYTNARMLGNNGSVTVLKQKRHEVRGIFSELQITYWINPNLYISGGIVKVL